MVVVDTSVIFKWFNESEEGFEKALSILKNHLDNKDRILIPTLTIYEITNAWSTKTILETEKIKNNLKLLKKYSLEIVNLDFSLLGMAVEFARAYNTTVYDAVYAVLAKEKKCYLITADDKFAKLVNLPFVKTLLPYTFQS